jgi:NAD(P)-dependent dehydrogenase (short-subunit alcohol dehydrogenase family)
MSRLEGKVAVVTGGASGMGLASVERFIEEGAKVVLTDLPAGDMNVLTRRVGETKASFHYRERTPGGTNDGFTIAQRLGPSAKFVPADITVPEELQKVIDTAVEEFGGLDILFNNAGIGGGEGSLLDATDEVFDRIIDVDLKAVLRGIKFAIPHLARRGGGSIISTSSTVAISGSIGAPAYSAAKGGIVALTRAAAMELAADMIRVNCICPGAILTPMNYSNPRWESIEPGQLRTMFAGVQPIPRAGEPIDIANAALWLASDESSFVTGQVIPVDGGLSAGRAGGREAAVLRGASPWSDRVKSG